ncbi:MAG: flavodoxin family protein [Oscillospiraceae bacterium]|nr:flavodoxin family protein [Oscillospiraceae bacterium]
MNILAFISSSSHSGNTATAAKRLLQGAADAGAETQLFYLNDYQIQCCRGCRTCERTDECVIKGDDVPLLHQALRAADAYVLGTPTFYGDITGQFKQFVDRCYPFVDVYKDPETKTMRFGSVIKERKPGVMIAVSGSHGDMVFDSHIKVGYFCLNDINSYPWREVLIPFTTWKPVKDQTEKLEELYKTGQDLVRYLASGEGEDTARTQKFYNRYRLLQYN